eukprot:CAMPEP_0116998948 /NCGR_PEP_ID=MMETSP0472-20121206/1848_1 /TAXON_ID=693140 ORGANISM="Tiarina fusus, Strain LIS" /NCGR_SAMPLE_ID=MMETSP0472 /ASSEMBLY_ACC=CAM_ASM_000603 /LENGTH=1137 /DNA_ID=CAMNT_0004698267 /DNA_START=140 /DNA_END=3554 /DNA_ORIENTATION=+
MANESPWNISDGHFLDEDDNITMHEPSAAPTASVDLVTSTDSEIIRETFRVYGSLYFCFFVIFCVARKRLPRLFNLRSWVPELECELAKTQEYGFISWCWQVFQVTDDQLLENCGMDALCYLRCLRLGSRLSLFGVFQAAWLIPVYLTAEESEETAYLTDIFVKMSIANLPNSSPRFAGAVIALYATILYSMHLVTKEFDWFTKYRHKFLSQREPRNYACYVSGIPPDYRSSYALADYFRQCSLDSAVLEAHIAVDTPSLDAKVARRDKVLFKLEHALALERKKGKTLTHRTFKIREGVDGVRKVDSVAAYRSELSDLNKAIALEIGAIQNSNHPFRKHLIKDQGSSNLVQEPLSPTDTKEEIEPSYETRSANTLSTVETMERKSDRTFMGIQPLHNEHRVDSFNIDNDSSSNEGAIVYGDSQTGLRTQTGLLAAQGPSGVSLGTITELAENSSRRAETVPEPISAESEESSQSESEQIRISTEEIPQHPFLSMFGLDASFFTQSYEDVRMRLNRAASDSDLTASVGRFVDDDMSQNGQVDDLEAQSEADCLDFRVPLDGEITESNGDIEEGHKFKLKRSSSIDSSFASRRAGSSGNQSWSSARTGMRSLPESVRRVGEMGSNGVKRVSTRTKVVGSKVRSAMKDVNRDAVSAGIKKAGSAGAQGIKTAGSIGVASVKKAAQKIQNAPDLGASIAASAAASAAAVVPVLLQKTDGVSREAGFIVFNDLYSTQAARQLLHHPAANTMTVEPAGSPGEIFWRNVGLPSKARRTGWLLSIVATSFLCFFWSIPSAFLSSLTEINSLKQKLPLLEDWIENAPWIEGFLALVAPLLLLLLNELVLPSVLKWFAAWEGHVSSPILEASLFEKLAAFTLIQTFFVSTISGTISAELSNILDDPEKIVDLLANSLPAQSSYFIQVCLVFTFFLQGFDLIRAYPLALAFFRRYFVGPRLTAKERRQTWKWFNSLEDPPEFWHAEILAQVMLFFVVYFVYSVIAPVSSVFLCLCFVICESGYRYHFIHNQHTQPDSGGRLWQGFISVLMISMLIGELTLVGLLILKKTVYALAALAPLIAMTLLFMIFVIPKRNHVARNLPTMLCVELDKKNMQEEGGTAYFASKKYLQPSLKAQPMYAEEPEDSDS